jgi:O-antigen ligase
VTVVEATALAPRPRRLPRLGLPVIAPLGLLLSLAIGGAAAVSPRQAAGLVVALAVGLVIASDARLLPILLTFTIFVESVAVGPGLRVGRIGAPIALALVAAYLLTRGSAGLRVNALLVAVGLYGLWIFASLIWADYPSYSARIFFTYVLAVSYMLAFAVLVRRSGQLFQIAATLAVGAVVMGLLGVKQYVTDTGLDTYRAVGLQGDPNYYAVYQVIALPLVLVLAARDRPARRPVYYAVLAVIAVSVVASLSRTGLLTFGLIAVATLLIPWRIFFRSRGSKRAYVIALALAAALAVGIGSSTLVSRASTIFDSSPTGDRGSGRTDLWRAAMHAYREHPWIGLGAGNFEASSLQYLQTTPGVDTTRKYVRSDRPVHNAYLEQLTDLGLPGLALFLTILFLTSRTLVVVVRRARVVGQRTIERFGIALLVSLGGFCFAGIFLSNQLLKPLWILIGLALALDVMTRDVQVAPASPRLGRRPRATVVASTQKPDAEMLRREWEQLEQRRRVVQELERELRSRLRPSPTSAPEPPRDDDTTRRRVDALTRREQELARRAAELAVREREVEARRRALAELEQRLHKRAEALAAPARVALPPAEPPTPVAPQQPEQEPELPPMRASPAPPQPAHEADVTLLELEALVREQSAVSPEQAEEWSSYLFYLRDYADAGGHLPDSFDGLVHEVFGTLLARR